MIKRDKISPIPIGIQPITNKVISNLTFGYDNTHYGNNKNVFETINT